MPVLKVKQNGAWKVIGAPTDVVTLVDELQYNINTLQNQVNELEDTVETSESEMIAYVDEKFAAVPEFDPTEIQSDIDANTAAIDENTSAIANNSSAIAEIQGDYLTSTDREQLQGEISEVSAKIDTIPEFDPTALQNAIDANTAAIDTKVDKEDGYSLIANDEKDRLATVEDYANFYEHPIHTSYNSGLYKVTIDSEGHISEATLVEQEDIITFVEKDDILALGIPDKNVIDKEISDLNDRADSIDTSIAGINEALGNVNETFEEYKKSNDAIVSENTDGILRNSEQITEIKNDYLKKSDKTELQNSIEQSIDNAFNEFAANLTDDGVINTYKELIDYAAEHGPEFTELVGVVNENTKNIASNTSSIENIRSEMTTIGDDVNIAKEQIGEVESDLADYKTEVSDQFAEVNTAILEHVHEDDKAAIADLQEKVGETSVADQISEAVANTTVEVDTIAYLDAYKISATVNGITASTPDMPLVRYDSDQTGLTDEQKQQARTNIGAVSYKDIYVQDEEPTDTPHGTLWIDLDDDLETWTWGDY